MSTPGATPPTTQERAALSRGKKILFSTILTALVLGCLQLIGWVAFALNPTYEVVRQTLLGNRHMEVLAARNVIGQAYLLYIPSPGLVRMNVEQHNVQGYRGAAVPLRRTPGKLRILFLGGSTTYGWLVHMPDRTYPAHVGKILEANLPEGFDGVEIINGGVVWATTAEVMTHYLFKYRYYKPDIVVLNVGGNDSQAAIRPNYHPDYSHWRTPIPKVHPLADGVRWLMHFRPLAFAAVRVFYIDLLSGAHFVKRKDRTLPAAWYSYDTTRRDGKVPPVPEEDLGFKNNLRTLVREIQAEGSELLLVPFRPKPGHTYGERVAGEMTRNEKILRELAAEYGADLAPFPGDLISPDNWADESCHLDGEGSREKAEHITEYLGPIIRRVRASRPQALAPKDGEQRLLPYGNTGGGAQP